MKYNVFAIIFFALCTMTSHAQDNRWAFGFYGDVLLEAPAYSGSFGVQGKYDLSNHQGLQAQVHGRNGFVAVGADYLLSVFNKKDKNFNIFLGAGAGEEFYSFHDENEIGPARVQDQLFVMNGQVGVSYLFAPVSLSVYSGYKVKYEFEAERFQPNFLMFGVRYHLW
ncbi:MAG TPA: hypothetical protein PKA53_02915 [Sphingobacterium sp.]|nr:hypothetical protein [Sphingobacterium sp.]